MDIDTKLRLNDEQTRLALKYAEYYQSEEIEIRITVNLKNRFVKIYCGEYSSKSVA
jgi:hypothetical protein